MPMMRARRGIENSLHRLLDFIVDEDEARNRPDHEPENLSLPEHHPLKWNHSGG
jgi:predicted transposase YbfD/YdcC